MWRASNSRIRSNSAPPYCDDRDARRRPGHRVIKAALGYSFPTTVAVASAPIFASGSGTSTVKPLRNTYDQPEHRRHAVFQDAKAALNAAETALHRCKPTFQGRKTAFHRRETVLQIAHFRDQGQNACAEQL
jgi:hypothetical protein